MTMVSLKNTKVLRELEIIMVDHNYCNKSF